MNIHDFGGKPIIVWVADSAVVENSEVCNADGARAKTVALKVVYWEWEVVPFGVTTH